MRSYDEVASLYQDTRSIRAALSLLNWDQQVLMPTGGQRARGNHLLRLTKLEHQILTSDRLSELVEKALTEASDFEAVQLRVLRNDIAKAKKLPTSLVQRKAMASSAAYQQWRKSREANDFPSMIPHYRELFDIARETATLLGYKDHIYDALIDIYEEGSTHVEAVKTLGALKAPTIDLVRRIREEGRPIDDSFLIRDWDQTKLRMAMERIINQIGFSLDCGRLDIAANAFCTNLSSRDVRMTTRPSEHFRGVVSSTLHEMGHGLYEQNQRPDWEFTSLRGGVSLAVHESQSRTWENVVGRSREFWDFFWIWFREQFAFFKEVDTDQFWRAYNKVEPGLIRVGSDELHYNLHILIRFELEVALVTKQLDVKDLPEAWNSKYEEYIGVRPATDAEGCLQDVHWSRGSVGYFPTYSYGNLIGVQIWNRLREDIPDVDQQIQSGSYRAILDWLVERVYGYGRMMRPKELIEHVVGEPMNAQPWLNYATEKFSAIYDLK
ncbi:MAG: carboxypeptidase M32 [Armatimonadetes bacterium]|nr:carboxypeptidase M32 [Armatimonadota bacterium]